MKLEEHNLLSEGQIVPYTARSYNRSDRKKIKAFPSFPFIFLDEEDKGERGGMRTCMEKTKSVVDFEQFQGTASTIRVFMDRERNSSSSQDE